MKRVKRTFSFLLILLLILNLAVFAGAQDKTEIRSLKKFDKVEVSAGIDLFISMGNRQEVKVVADEDIIDEVKTEVRNGTLHVTMDNSGFFNFFNWGNGSKSKQVFVTVTELRGIDVSSGADVKSENTLKGDQLELDASSGSDMEVEVIFRDISLEASSGSDVKIRGRAKTFRAHASSGSDINGRQLEASVAHVKASSGSDISLTVTEELEASASSGGDVTYYGNPELKEIETSSGGDVSGR